MKTGFDRALESAQAIVHDAFALTPNLAVGLLVLLLFIYLGNFAKSSCVNVLRRKLPAHVALIVGRLVQAAVFVTAGLVVLSIVVPSFRTADLIQMLGIGSVAVGFAFKDVFQNFLAGMIVLLSQPFRIGDKISVSGFTGEVISIETRATVILQEDGGRVIIPNAMVFTLPVVVHGS